MISHTGPLDLAVVKRMSESMVHRGPDGRGYLGWSDRTGLTSGRDVRDLQSPWAALIHRRLSILDLSEAGAQPMSTDDGQVHLAYNGEVYNYVELREELKACGVKFHSRSDTEVVLQAYAQWGSDAFRKMVGMFAVALLDLRKQAVVLARDFFGIKPLFYVSGGDRLLFASEIQTLLDVPGVSRRLCGQRYLDYLRFARTDSEPQTLFEDVRQIMPGHVAEWDLNTGQPVSKEAFWTLRPEPRSDLTRRQAVDLVREEFLHNIRLHLRSDLPVGACLSGGIDSSSIVMAVRHLLGRDAEIHAFSYVPDDVRLSEERHIDLVSRRARTITHKVRPNMRDLVRDIDHLVKVQGEPFNGLSIYAQHRVFQKAHEKGVKVMLDGQGADELLGGYQGISRMTRLASLFSRHQFVRGTVFAMRLSIIHRDLSVQQMLKQGFLHIHQAISPPQPDTPEGPMRLPDWLDSDWFERHGIQGKYKRNLPVHHPREVLRTYLQHTVEKTSLPHLLRYEDRNSMAFSIESRVPFLTPRFAELMLSLPEEYLVDDRCVSKSIFRQAMRGIVPHAILDRTDKIGFTTPMDDWLITLHPWVSEKLDSEMAHALPGLDLDRIQRRWQAVVNRKESFKPWMWRVLNMICWSENAQPVWTK